MSHSHSGPSHAAGEASGARAALVDPDELRRHRRALRILIVILIPLAVWTIVGLVAFWPGQLSRHINADVAGYSVPGVTYPAATITAIKEVSCEGLPGSTPGVSDTSCANVTAQLREGAEKGQSVDVALTSPLYESGTKVGQVIKLVRVPPADGQPVQYQFSDFERRTPLIFFTVLFAVVVVAVARWRGLAALLGLGFAGFILVAFMFPALVAGSNPVMVGLIGSSAIMFVVLYATHGFSARTTTALVGTLFGLILIAALGYLATRWAHLTGVAAEDDYVLAAAAPDLKLTSVVLCGVIVAGLGVLNDVTITQASAVWELADHGESQRKLFSRAMRIGRDHIASTVYTIAFATAGASLSVLLLLVIYDRPLLQVLQTEQFAGEVIRTLVGSIGLVLAVPLTTAVGVAVVRASARRAGSKSAAARARPELDAEGAEPAGVAGTAAPASTASGGPGAAGRPTPARGTSAAPARPARSRREPESEVETTGRFRRFRRDDDFGDFSYLRDDAEPSDPPPDRTSP